MNGKNQQKTNSKECFVWEISSFLKNKSKPQIINRLYCQCKYKSYKDVNLNLRRHFSGVIIIQTLVVTYINISIVDIRRGFLQSNTIQFQSDDQIGFRWLSAVVVGEGESMRAIIKNPTHFSFHSCKVHIQIFKVIVGLECGKWTRFSRCGNSQFSI